MKTLQLGPWPNGINDRQAAHALPAGTLHDAVNVDLDNLGNPSRRAGYALDHEALYLPGSSNRFDFQHGARRYVVGTETSVLLFSEAFDTDVADTSATVTDVRQVYNRIPFPTAINVCVPVTGGIWVATAEKSYFLSGYEPGAFAQVGRIPGGLFDSGKLLPDGRAIWTSTQGVMVGGLDGSLTNMTYDNLKPLEGSEVAAGVFRIDGATRYVTVLR